MFALACCLLLLAAGEGDLPKVAATTNRVEVCSLAAGDCQSFAAADLDPTRRPPAPASGQLAFIDPVTGARVAPTGEQLGELQLIIEEEEKFSSAEPTFETLPDGTLRATLNGALGAYLKARLQAKSPAAGERPR